MTLELDSQQAVIDDAEAVESIPSEEATASSDEVFVIKRTTFNYFIIAIAFLMVGVFIGAMIFSPRGGSDITAEMISTAVVQALNSPNVVRTAPTPGPAPFVNVSVDDDPAWGPEDAPVVMVEFSDFQCPFCGRFYQETYPRLRETYGDRIRFVYRDLPLPQIHPDAILAAQAAECADEQGAFWEYHDLIFSNQQDLSRTALGSFATQLELDTEAFNQCLDSGRYEQEIASDMQAASSYGIRGTPTFFINGRPIVGAQPFEVFAAVIDEELARAAAGS
jgi:protein-disulfide isomerase